MLRSRLWKYSWPFSQLNFWGVMITPHWDFPPLGGDLLLWRMLPWAVKTLIAACSCLLAFCHHTWLRKTHLSCLATASQRLVSEKHSCWNPRGPEPQTRKLRNGAQFPSRSFSGKSLTASVNIPVLLEITSWFSITHTCEVMEDLLTPMSFAFCLRCVCPVESAWSWEVKGVYPS